MKNLLNLLQTNVQPVDLFKHMEQAQVLAQFVSNFIPGPRQVPVALVADESDDEQVPSNLNHEFLMYCFKHRLGYDDFPSTVRCWDTEERAPVFEEPLQPLDWEENFLRLVK